MPNSTWAVNIAYHAQIVANNVQLNCDFCVFTTPQESFLDNVFWLKIKFSGKFESYDYGSGNMAHYGQETPINYDLTKVLGMIISLGMYVPLCAYIFGNIPFCEYFEEDAVSKNLQMTIYTYFLACLSKNSAKSFFSSSFFDAILIGDVRWQRRQQSLKETLMTSLMWKTSTDWWLSSTFKISSS